MQLSATQERFVRRWGEMGTRWGIPHSMAMLHGLLYICAARVLGSIVGDVMLTRDEIAGLSQDRLAVDCPPAGRRSLREWVARHAGTLGKTYASELSRRR